ncbi:glutamine amidotransferase [Rubricella aquisinus]|uniref:Glutamine amidotransferase n=1 Tax=Rubricella aquisinus TaxID=2028108 RepID=A0A840WL62_9RHOB|nr:class II glutamine amidotransferase [Rubricella aquisinus]MBB5514893.1 glutamine amidotransferase [Rubricella aquisinus]
MCRWAAYIGAPIFLEDIISRPAHSLIVQARDASECKTAINADGFGVAWYAHRPEPGLYRDVLPAWSDHNLRALAEQVKSSLFLAHVRASTGTATSRNNCHPFTHGRWSFMHNGQIGGFERFRKRADMLIPDALYDQRRGATDSEALFLLAVAEGLEDDPKGALERAAGQLHDLSVGYGTTPHLRLTCALSDGDRLYALRYASDDFAPSLYHRWSASRNGRAVVSEPLETGEADWVPVAPGTFMTFEEDQARSEPFVPVTSSAGMDCTGTAPLKVMVR